MTARTATPDLQALRAPNPSPMTGTGTMTYLLRSAGAQVVIDPGPEDAGHLQAILGALAPGATLQAILVTHAHHDHTGLAAQLARATGAPILAAGPAGTGRSPLMEELAARGLSGGGEGMDHNFRPDRHLVDGEILAFGASEIQVLATPGHTGCSLCFAWQDQMFSGDTLMGWAPSLVSPPDGDMAAYLGSLQRLASRRWTRAFPGHGDVLDDPAARLAELIAHRRARETQILAELARGGATPPALTARIYGDVDPALHGAAARNVLAHLIDLWSRNRVLADPLPLAGAVFSLP